MWPLVTYLINSCKEMYLIFKQEAAKKAEVWELLCKS